jgi:prepilin-type N-terminal cleavage/methylation domain-containing protein
MECRTQRLRKVRRLLARGGGSECGFTLIELLVVIVIIAILAAVAIPTFMGQRGKAQDTAAYTLVRNAFTAIQADFVEHGSYALITAADLAVIEPSINWVQSAVDLVRAAPAWIADPVGANAADNQVAFFPESADVIDVATTSRSGNSFGMQIDALDLGQSAYVKVKVIDGSVQVGW